MQKTYKLVTKFIFLLSLFYLAGCSSSSYYERYGNHTKSDKLYDSQNYEDEMTDPQISVAEIKSEAIIKNLSKVINSNSKKKIFLNEIINYLYTPYVYGGTTRKGIDCSAFTKNIYNESLNINLPRTAREQYKKWQIFHNKNDLKFGDLIYFNTSNKYYPGHVGIYLDDNLFAHASSSSGVIISSLEEKYYKTKYIGANRVKVNNTNQN